MFRSASVTRPTGASGSTMAAAACFTMASSASKNATLQSLNGFVTGKRNARGMCAWKRGFAVLTTVSVRPQKPSKTTTAYVSFSERRSKDRKPLVSSTSTRSSPMTSDSSGMRHGSSSVVGIIFSAFGNSPGQPRSTVCHRCSGVGAATASIRSAGVRLVASPKGRWTRTLSTLSSGRSKPSGRASLLPPMRPGRWILPPRSGSALLKSGTLGFLTLPASWPPAPLLSPAACAVDLFRCFFDDDDKNLPGNQLLDLFSGVTGADAMAATGKAAAEDPRVFNEPVGVAGGCSPPADGPPGGADPARPPSPFFHGLDAPLQKRQRDELDESKNARDDDDGCLA